MQWFGVAVPPATWTRYTVLCGDP